MLSAAEIHRLVAALEAEVNNGGFDQFFFNASGDEAAATIQALEAAGARATAAIVRDACGKFPGGMPPVEQPARRAMLLDSVSPEGDAFEADDAAFLAYPDDLTALTSAYSTEQSSKRAAEGPLGVIESRYREWTKAGKPQSSADPASPALRTGMPSRSQLLDYAGLIVGAFLLAVGLSISSSPLKIALILAGAALVLLALVRFVRQGTS